MPVRPTVQPLLLYCIMCCVVFNSRFAGQSQGGRKIISHLAAHSKIFCVSVSAAGFLSVICCFFPFQLKNMCCLLMQYYSQYNFSFLHVCLCMLSGNRIKMWLKCNLLQQGNQLLLCLFIRFYKSDRSWWSDRAVGLTVLSTWSFSLLFVLLFTVLLKCHFLCGLPLIKT